MDLASDDSRIHEFSTLSFWSRRKNQILAIYHRSREKNPQNFRLKKWPNLTRTKTSGKKYQKSCQIFRADTLHSKKSCASTHIHIHLLLQKLSTPFLAWDWILYIRIFHVCSFSLFSTLIFLLLPEKYLQPVFSMQLLFLGKH